VGPDVPAIRLATADDSERLFAWRNDPDTRRASHNTDVVPPERHAEWFEKSLQRSDRIMLIAMLHEQAVGTVRFDKRPDSYLEVSINIAPEARAKKLGAVCLGAACDFILTKKSAGFHAEIRSENVASIRIFQRCGFHETGRKGEFLVFRRDPDQRPRAVGAGSGDV
jgi:RimJ/RimL family protein N-acetyltransferase